MPLDIALGRALAVVIHPRLAWRILSTFDRVLLAAAYFGVSYVTALAALFLLG